MAQGISCHGGSTRDVPPFSSQAKFGVESLARHAGPMRIADARQLFPGAPGYLNSASIGLPPVDAVAAMDEAIREWQHGQAHAPDYDEQLLSGSEKR